MRVRQARGRRSRIRFGAVAALLVGGWTLFPALETAHGYRFFSDGNDDELVGADDAMRWSPDVWGPGETLVFEIADVPDFESLYGSAAEARRYVERAMAPWSNLATADIRWRLDGDLAGDPRGEATFWNGRNTVLMDREQETAGAAYLRAERSSPSGAFEIVECDIAIGRWYAEIHRHVEPDYLSDHREFVVAMLVHEFGHCLGLGHSSAVLVPKWKAGAFDYTTLTPSLGGVGGLRSVDDVAADDVVGASLLRPAPGWRSGTGSIAGSLELDGEPLYEQFVWALPARDHPMRGGVGAYSNADGAFLIEGLDPGRYFLWGGPTVEGNGPLLKLHETLFGSPVDVRAGQTTAGLTLDLREGRVPRPPPER